MDKHCKGCVYHHDAGYRHPLAKNLFKYNNWCCAKGTAVNVGWCKQHSAKKVIESRNK